MYAGRTLNFVPDQTVIGFTLPSTSVSTNINPSGSDIIMLILYSLTCCLLYSISVCLFPCWCFCPTEDRRKHKKEVKDAMNSSKELVGGMLITAILTIAFEFCIRFAYCIIWTVHQDNVLGAFLATWLPQLLLFAFATSVNICAHCITCFKIYCLEIKYRNIIYYNHKRHSNDGHTNRCRCCVNNTRRVFTSKVHIILPIHLVAFGLLYCFFPAIILIFVFPAQMIAIFTFVPAYLFASTVIFAIVIKFYGWFLPDARKISKICIFIPLFLVLCLVLFFIYFLVLVFLYALVIGRGSVVNTGPLFIISLFPSITISIGAWIAKRIVLNRHQNIFSVQKEVQNKFAQTETV